MSRLGKFMVCVLTLWTGLAQAQTSSMTPEKYGRFLELLRNNQVCQVYKESGRERGYAYQSQIFPNCTAVYLTKQTFDRFFSSTSEARNFEERCFDIGFRLGFITAYDDTWGPCGEELSTTISNSNSEALLECNKLATDVSQSKVDLTSVLSQAEQENPDIKASMIEILSLYSAGEYETSWKKIIELHQKEQRNLVPCALLLAKTWK